MNDHLSEDEFSDLLIEGFQRQRALAHLDLCEQCHVELTIWRASAAAFRELGGNWAQREIEILGAAATPGAACLRKSHKLAVGFGIATTAAAVVLALLAGGIPRVETSPTLPPAGPSAAEIAHDNQWLTSMDQDLRSVPDDIAMLPSKAQVLHEHIASHHRNEALN